MNDFPTEADMLLMQGKARRGLVHGISEQMLDVALSKQVGDVNPIAFVMATKKISFREAVLLLQ